MGMTQNFYAVEKEDVIDNFDFSDNHGEKYGWNEFANFSKDYEIYNWMYTLWKEKVAVSHTHEDNSIKEEYLLLNEEDILRLEKDFHNKKINFDHSNRQQDKQMIAWLENRFQDFLNMAKKYLKANFVIYYEVR